MNPVAAQQVALDNALVAPKKRINIEKRNARIEFSKPQREDIYRVTLDALKLSPCYPAFLITAEVPENYPRLPNQDFVESPSEEEMVPFIKELGYTRKCDMLSDIHTDHMHLSWRTFDALINRCIIGKSTVLDRLRPSRAQILWGMLNQKNVDYVALLWEDAMFQANNREISSTYYQMYGTLIPEEMINQDIKEEEPAKKPKRAKKPAKKSTTVPTSGVVIRDTPGVSVSKKKAPAKLKKVLKKRKLDIHMLHASGSDDVVGSQPKVLDESQDKTTGINKGTGTKPVVPNVPKDHYESENESWGNSKDDDSNDDGSDDIPNDDDNDVDSDADADNEAHDSERTDSDEDENPNLIQNDDAKEEYKEEYVHTPDNYKFSNDDEEYKELYKDVNVSLKDAKHKEEGKGDLEMTDAGRDDKTEGPMQSSLVSSDFASQFLNLDNVPPVENEVVSMMNVKVRHEEPSTQTPSFLTIHVMVIPETSTAAAPNIPLTIPPITPILQHKAYALKRDRENKDKDEDPPDRSDQGLKRRKTRKDSVHVEESVFETVDTEMPQNKGSDLGNTDDQPNHLVGTAFNLLKRTYRSRVELEYHFKECYKAVTYRLDWNNPEGQEYPFDINKPLPKYMTSTTKTKAAKYDDIQGIEDMVPSLWTPVKMFTRRVVILKRVEDLQLGVESYQKKLNITKPKTFRSDISKRTPYTAYNNPQGIIYVDKYKRNRLMCPDELYKFSDGMLKSV
ncbi:hypothetical protein Tco_0841268 [Tanacetum coccineum]|uniref:Uncharacterized protein n=1 Tax=Tanacetum coccineum TaxID=301880 RepID=A0ABQ5AWX7_9ASTR